MLDRGISHLITSECFYEAEGKGNYGLVGLRVIQGTYGGRQERNHGV